MTASAGITSSDQMREPIGAVESRNALRLAPATGRLGSWKWDMAAGDVRFDPHSRPASGCHTGFDGRFETYQSMLHPEDRGYVLEVAQAAVVAGADYDVEHRCNRPDGSVHWLQGRGSVTRDDNGTVSGRWDASGT